MIEFTLKLIHFLTHPAPTYQGAGIAVLALVIIALLVVFGVGAIAFLCA